MYLLLLLSSSLTIRDINFFLKLLFSRFRRNAVFLSPASIHFILDLIWAPFAFPMVISSNSCFTLSTAACRGWSSLLADKRFSIVCVCVQRFEPQDRLFTNCHYYYDFVKPHTLCALLTCTSSVKAFSSLLFILSTNTGCFKYELLNRQYPGPRTKEDVDNL